jgi:L-2-hydroxyglutarate oxidase LhgO
MAGAERKWHGWRAVGGVTVQGRVPQAVCRVALFHCCQSSERSFRHAQQHIALACAYRPDCALKDTGSLLLASSSDEAQALVHRSDLLTKHGVQAVVLDAADTKRREPALTGLSGEGAGLLVEADAQIVSRRAFAMLLHP